MPAMYVPLPRRLRHFPEVQRIAIALKVDPLLVVGALHEVWAYCQDVDSLKLAGAHDHIEQYMQLPAGLFAAMELVGWAEVRATVVDLLWMPAAPNKGGRPRNPKNGSETVSEGFETVSQRDTRDTSERESDRKGERSNERRDKRKPPAPLADAGVGSVSLSPEEEAELNRLRALDAGEGA